MTARLALAALLCAALAGGVGLALPRAAGQEAPRALLSVDTTMLELSAATGGDFYFWSRGEFARASLRLPLGGEDLLLAYGALAGERAFEVPVDTLLDRLELFVGTQELEQVLVRRPDGSLVAGGPRERIQAFEHMRLATIEHPASGPWRVEVRGRGLFCVTARGGAGPSLATLEPIVLVDFDFVELRGRPGHEGWFPLEREPRAGEELMARVHLSGSAASAELGFAGADGRPLAAPWIPLPPAPGEETVHASCVVPAVPCRAVVRGLDVSGAPFQRVHAPRLAPATR